MRKAEATDNVLFDRFWAAYPRKEEKPKAFRWFQKMKITPEVLEKIMAELERQAKVKDWAHIEEKWIPLPLTWLNRRDWENGAATNDDIPKDAFYGAHVF